MTNEKRLYTRVRIKIPVNYRVWDLEEGTMKTHAQGRTSTLDVGQGGARLPIRTSTKLPGAIELEFLAPSPIRATGRIRWFHPGHGEDPPRLGVEFIEITNEDRHRLLLFGLKQKQKPA